MCTTIEQRGVVQFFVGKKYCSKGYAQRNVAHVGKHCLSRQAVLGPLKQHISGKRFSDYNAVERAVCAWF
jgi:hypothetical protein